MLALLATLTLAACDAEGTSESPVLQLTVDPAKYGTWAWDGSTWTQLSRTSFVEHASGGELYPARLDYWKGLGGLIAMDRTFPFDPTTWASVEMWTGSDWVTDAAFPSPPPNVSDDAVIFDPANDQLISVDTKGQTIWAWLRGSWVSVVPTDQWMPPKTFGVAKFAYDPYRQEVLILFCCQPPSGPVDDSKPCSYDPCDETWAWNGRALTKRSAAPIPNDVGRLVPDDGGHMLTFGNQQDLSWDGKSWSPLASGLACPKSSVDLTALDMAYDAAHKQLIAIGPDTAYGFHMWRWIDGNWKPMSPESSPPPGSDSIVYDPALPGLVLTVVPPPSPSVSGPCST